MEAWRDFYQVVGTAAASLVGLIFVAMSITSGAATERQHAAREAYATPTIVHLAAVLVVSLLALVPAVAPTVEIVSLATEALAFAYALIVVVRVWVLPQADLEDRICYGIAPALCYVVLAAGSLAIALGRPVGSFVFAGGVLVLLLAAIRNAWDLTVWIAIRAQDK